jgi:hypothetical protein
MCQASLLFSGLFMFLMFEKQNKIQWYMCLIEHNLCKKHYLINTYIRCFSRELCTLERKPSKPKKISSFCSDVQSIRLGGEKKIIGYSVKEWVWISWNFNFSKTYTESSFRLKRIVKHW